MKTILITLTTIIISMAMASAQPKYDILRVNKKITLDGDITDKEWKEAAWTNLFVDIQGDKKPAPKFQTRAKMLYDDKYIYIAAEMIEPQLWGTITKRDATMYWENDFEVFIDMQGNSKNYYEFEFSPMNAQWDLMMTAPYSQGGTFKNDWNVEGMLSAVKLYGTLNDPRDIDEKWTMEIAIPLDELVTDAYGKKTVEAGDTWRMNFSRVQWLKYHIDSNGRYQKNEGTNGFGHEENWVWAPTGVVDIHRPDKWGYVTFK